MMLIKPECKFIIKGNFLQRRVFLALFGHIIGQKRLKTEKMKLLKKMEFYYEGQFTGFYIYRSISSMCFKPVHDSFRMAHRFNKKYYLTEVHIYKAV